jgi:hypothetical protein
MNLYEKTSQVFEQSMVEHERWTSAILHALHELRCASAAGLDRYGSFFGEGALSGGGEGARRDLGET